MLATRINLVSIDVLQNVLGSLKNIGPTDNIWGCPIYDEDTYLTNGTAFLEGMHALHQLREAHTTLSALLSSLDRALGSLRDATYPAVLSRGIDSLPDEVLAYIMTLAGARSVKEALDISRVSRRFRSVALTTPRLWSNLPSPFMTNVNRGALSLCLERSKNTGLEVELPLMITEDFQQNPDWDEALGMLMEHKHRWMNLTVDLTAIHYVLQRESNGIGAPTLAKLLFPKATLDNVQRLCIGDSPHRFCWPGYGSDYDRYDDASPEFYSSWKFPNLKTLVSDMHIPPAGVFSSLTELSLDLSIHDSLEPHSFEPPATRPPIENRLVEFLNSVPTLQTFTLVTGEYIYGPIFGSINLPSLTTLHLENHYAHPESVRLLRNVSKALHIPAVESIKMAISVQYSNEWFAYRNDDWIGSFFPDAKLFRKLKRFQLEYAMEKNFPMKIVGEVTRFPALEELEISSASAPCIADSITDSIPAVIMSMPPLRNMKVRFRDTHLQHETAVREYTFDNEGMSFRSFFES